MHKNQKLGQWGENVALNYCLEKGYNIVTTNFHTKSGEVDIIAYDHWRQHYYFIEVKTQTGSNRDTANSNLTPKKLRRVKRAGETFLLRKFKNILAYEIHAIIINKKTEDDYVVEYLDELEL